ncbi:MAG: TIGR03905 family TSCPD domain-containing protein [Paraclostridium sp.]
MYRYYTQGVCAKSILLDIKDNKLMDVVFEGGCAGNLIGIKHLIEGKNIDEIMEHLEGIPCKERGTSCPDQLSKALKIYKNYVLEGKKRGEFED